MAPGQPPLANIVTLGVRDFGAQRDFYRRLGELCNAGVSWYDAPSHCLDTLGPRLTR